MPLIWLDIPEIGLKEMIYALSVENDLFEIQEIPFISREVNYHDTVRCKSFLAGYYDFIEVVRPSGYETIHVAFTETVILDKKRKVVSDLLKMGVLYRRSGLLAFAFSICPGPDKGKAIDYINDLFTANIIVEDDRKESGSVSNVMAALGYMLNPLRLNDGLADDEEMDYFPRRQTSPTPAPADSGAAAEGTHWPCQKCVPKARSAAATSKNQTDTIAQVKSV